MTTQELMEHKRCTFEVFCKAVLRNKARNLHKKRNQIERTEVFVADMSEELETCLYYEDCYDFVEQITVSNGAKKYLLDNETLAAALTVLVPKYREVLFLSYFMGCSDKEIGKILELPPSTVNTQKASAIKRLREIMGADDGR